MASPRRSGITGHDQVIANLRELAKGPTPQEIDTAATESLEPMLQKTRARLRRLRNYVGKYPGFPQPRSPRKGGHVDQGIVVRKQKATSSKKRSYRLGATKRARYLLHLVEFGTAPHWQPHFRGGWQHPGARANPVLIPTFDEERGNVPKVFGQKIWNTIASKIARMKKSSRRKR